MSDNWIRIIPEDPEHVPDRESQDRASNALGRLAPDADEVSAITDSQVVFRDCGANFSRVSCPSCRADLDIGTWSAMMEADFDDDEGFSLTQHSMPCCGKPYTLQELLYDQPQGFGRFELSALNPGIGSLAADQCREFEALLGCTIRVIYQHL